MSDVEITQADPSHTGLEGCACPSCGGGLASSGTDLASLDPLAGGTSAGKPIWTPDQIAAYLNRTGGGFADGFNDGANVGRQNNIGDGAKVITFGFFETQQQVIDNGYTYRAPNAQGVMTLYGLAEVFNFATFTTAQRDATREAMQAWDDLIAVSFVETNANDADMNFGNLASAPTTQAYARIPTAGLDATLGGQVREIGGDSWISASQASNFQLDEGGYGMQTLAHEIGHSLGLSHPGAYNAAPGVSITYGANADYAQDTRAYSIMSYFQASVVPPARHFDFNISATVYAATPLIHDIVAIQRIYGADMTTRTGDTVYGFNSNAGRDSYDFVKTPAPVMAIWDAGGNDTLDASGYATTQLIDLTPGSLSSIGGVTAANAPTLQQVNANRALIPGLAPVTQATYDANMAALRANPTIGRLMDNVGIAYGVIIENAKGGSGADTIIGNTADNELFGNAGDDTLSGNGGNDTLDGGAGSDTLAGGAGNDRFIVDNAGDVVIENVGEGIDTVVTSLASYTLGANVENLELVGGANGTGNDSANTLTGNAAANTLKGEAGADTLFGLGGDDRLEGGAGNDRLSGGDGRDVFLGGTGDDIFVGDLGLTKVLTKQGSMSVDIFLDFDLDGDDFFDMKGLDANSTLAGVQAFEFVGHASGNRAGDLSFRTFGNINAAEEFMGIDLDGLDGPGAGTPVTIVFGDLDGDKNPDFAMVLIGTKDVDASDFIF